MTQWASQHLDDSQVVLSQWNEHVIVLPPESCGTIEVSG